MANMVWIPWIDGGSIQLPDTDPRVIAYRMANPQIPPAALAKPAQAPPVKYPGFSHEQLHQAHKRHNAQQLQTVEAQTRIIVAMVFQEYNRRYLRQQSVLDTDFYSAPNDEDHDRSVVTIIGFLMEWSAMDISNYDQQLIEARIAADILRESGATTATRPSAHALAENVRLMRNSLDQLFDLKQLGGIFAQSLILRDAERYLWGRSGGQQFDAEHNWLINSYDWPAANTVYEWWKALSMITGQDWAKGGNQVFSPLGGDFWFHRGIVDHQELDSDPHRPHSPLPPTYGRIWAARQLE